jgi:hypothetical protein
MLPPLLQLLLGNGRSLLPHGASIIKCQQRLLLLSLAAVLVM